MSREVREFAVTIPSGTLAAAPYKVQLNMPARVVKQIRVRVPPGPNGVMGFAIGSAGIPVIPINGSWIITNDATLDFPLTSYIDSGTWWFIGYNTGTFTHTVYLTFTCTLTGTKTGTALGTATTVGSVATATSTTPGQIVTPIPPPTFGTTPGTPPVTTPGTTAPPKPAWTPTVLPGTRWATTPRWSRNSNATLRYLVGWRELPTGTIIGVFSFPPTMSATLVAFHLGATSLTITKWTAYLAPYNPKGLAGVKYVFAPHTTTIGGSGGGASAPTPATVPPPPVTVPPTPTKQRKITGTQPGGPPTKKGSGTRTPVTNKGR